MNKENFTMLCDFYELTMSNGYFQSKMSEQVCYFDVFYRSVPDNGGFAIACGLESIIDYINNLKFTDDDIKYLESKNMFSKEFPDYPQLHRPDIVKFYMENYLYPLMNRYPEFKKYFLKG